MSTHATVGSSDVVVWGIERSAELLALVDRAHPDDRVTVDELEMACWGPGDRPDPTRCVLGSPDGSAAIALRDEGEHSVIEVLAGTGESSATVSAVLSELIRAASIVARTWGASSLVIGASVPDHLWPGLTADEPVLVDALEAAGFTRLGDATVDAVATTFRSAGPVAGVHIERLVDDELVDAALRWVHASAPRSEHLVRRAIDQATGCVAVDDATGEIVGAGAHSLGRDGWIGPVVVADDARRRGIATALVADAARDLMVAGFTDAPLAWSAPEGLDGLAASWPAGFLDRVGARPWRTFHRWALELG